MVLSFFDSNVLLYADDGRDAAKQERARDLVAAHMRERLCVVSLQVMQEYFNGATRKLGVSAAVAQQKVEVLARGAVVRFGPGDVIAAIQLHRLRGVSFWDALIVHAAGMAGAPVLYSEDLQDGVVFSGVRVVNPFVGLGSTAGGAG